MVNNSTNISKTNNYLSLLTLEHKNRLQHMTIEIEWRMMPVVQKYSPIIHSSVKTLWLIATKIWKYFCTYELYNKCLSNRSIMLNDCYNCTAAATTKEVRNTGFGTRVMRRLTLVKQELPTLPGHLGSLSVFSEDGIAQSLVFCVECCVCLFFCHCTVCPLRFTAFHYPFGIFKCPYFKIKQLTCIITYVTIACHYYCFDSTRAAMCVIHFHFLFYKYTGYHHQLKWQSRYHWNFCLKNA